MKSVQDYIDRYKGVVKNLGYAGESADILIQLLANASWIGEVENASYMAESSLEKASLINSKIQHCVDMMYSVYRGACPRVIMKIKPTKYLTLNPYDPIIESSNFRIYYLGYYKVIDADGNVVRGSNVSSPSTDTEDGTTGDEEETDENIIKIIPSSSIMDVTNPTGTVDPVTPDDDETYEYDDEEIKHATLDELIMDHRFTGTWEYSSATFYPVLEEDDPETDVDDTVDGIQIIIGFIAPKRIGEENNMKIDKVISTANDYYVDCTAENLSDDVFIQVGAIDEQTNQVSDMSIQPKTRIFAEHILEHKIFDLTIPSFGSRLYVANFYKDIIGRDSQEVEGITSSAKISAQYYGYSELDDYNESELRRVALKGAELLHFNDVQDEDGKVYTNPFLIQNSLTEYDEVEGLCYIDAVPRDDLNTIHYKANRDRYVNSILRSNSDIGTVLEETYPGVVKSGGTSYVFNANTSSARYSTINLYYIPKQENVLLTDEEIEKFKKEKRAYYVITSIINVEPGHKFTATFDISLDLFKGSTEDWDQLVGQDILVSGYEKKFGVTFDESTKKDIEAVISKISNVKRISSLNVTYMDGGRSVTADYIAEKYGVNAYYEIKYSITTSVNSTGGGTISI